MKRLFSLVFLSLILTSCEEKDCERFDFSNRVTGWHLFPDREPEYLFESDSITKTFERVYEDVSKSETISCGGGCECNRLFHATYFGHSIRFQSSVLYDIDREDYPQPIIFSANNQDIHFDMDASANIIGNYADGDSINPQVTFTVLDTLSLNNDTYSKVLHVISLKETFVTQWWISYGFGLVAFEHDGETYFRKKE